LDGETATGDGETATGNLYGLLLYDSSNNTVRGNVISGNITSGVEINENSPDNVIEGNLIGTNASGTAVADYNAEAMSFGIVAGGSNTTIGGETESSRNIISGNYRYGVYVTLAAENVTIQGNYIGTDITGTFALGNETAGLHLDSASNIMVSDNVISGNAIGIWVASSGPVTIDNNYIGTDATGTAPLGNIYAGVSFLFGSNTTLTENIIAYNSYMGVGSNNGMNNRISANRIFANELVGDPPEDWPDTPSGLGIDLYDVGTLIGVTPNDPGDADTGANNLQNFPELTRADYFNNQLDLLGTLNSAANTQFRIEFFANNACDASGYGEGETYLGFAEVTTDGSGNALIDETLTASVSLGQFITATTIDPGGNTSEFSACVEVEAGPLAAPTDLVATAESSTTIGLSWTDTSSDETGFSVERSLTGSDGWTEIGTTAADVDTYTDEGLICETEYFYRVRAMRDSDVSDYSNTDSATTLSCLEIALRTPRDGSATTSTRPNFRWQRNRDADRYRFELATDEDFTTLVLFSETPNNRRTSYRVPRSDALGYGVYYWRVLADSGSGSFVPASEVRMLTVTPRLPRPPRQSDPRNNARLNDPTPTLSWEAVSGAGDPFTYEIEIDDDARFRSPEISASVDGLSYSPASDLADGRWYWRV
ncbi:MAG: right-handed parallel beta-helix repeat-containing protein, partial [Anaerolineae bacterium]|nr:right-handed parallel beta-helix repeat-containing protein [Anaerolineae bacterium]